MNTEDYFYNLKTKSVISEQLLDYARSIENWRYKLADWVTFQQVDIPKHLIAADPVLRKLKELEWIDFKIFKNYPHSFYAWHIDRPNRPAAINMVIGQAKAHTFFSGERLWKNQFEVLEADYQPNTYMLFNTFKQHSVFNLSEERYIVSVSVPKKYVVDFDWKSGESADKNSAIEQSAKVYHEILKDFKQQNL